MKNIADLMNLKGRRALVTGAIGSLGQEIALTIAELGADLLLVDRPGADYSLIKEKISDNWHVNADSLDCDLEDEIQREKLINKIKTDGKLDILVNNAAFVGDSNLQGWNCEFTDQSVETWRRVIEVNLTTAFDLSKGLYSTLKESKHASIINISSIYGINGPDYSLYKDTDMGNPAAYAVSKGGLIQLTKWLSTTLAPDIRVNVISPGGIFRNQKDSFVKRYESRTPLKRMANEEDLKGAIAYLSSDLSRYVTGQNIIVDGGWSVW